MRSELKLYNTSDKDALLGIFNSNVPQYFDPSELAPFKTFLDDIHGNYFSCRNDGKIIGAGGYCEEEEGEARICWLMIDHSLHGKGAGTFIMKQFQELIETEKKFNRITLKTSQHTNKFYETLGFKTTMYEEDHWVKGMHLYFMEKQLH